MEEIEKLIDGFVYHKTYHVTPENLDKAARVLTIRLNKLTKIGFVKGEVLILEYPEKNEVLKIEIYLKDTRDYV